jgi:hypothetical protein
MAADAQMCVLGMKRSGRRGEGGLYTKSTASSEVLVPVVLAADRALEASSRPRTALSNLAKCSLRAMQRSAGRSTHAGAECDKKGAAASRLANARRGPDSRSLDARGREMRAGDGRHTLLGEQCLPAFSWPVRQTPQRSVRGNLCLGNKLRSKPLYLLFPSDHASTAQGRGARAGGCTRISEAVGEAQAIRTTCPPTQAEPPRILPLDTPLDTHGH